MENVENLLQRLNFHHLHYFWAVANDGNLTHAARRLRVAQSALSAQIRQLEARLGAPLFAREGRRLVLNEAGAIVHAYAEDIFRSGGELLATFESGRSRTGALRVGAVGTLSRNFQESFVRPVLDEPGAVLQLHSGRLDDLLDRLDRHALDVVLSNRPVRAEGAATRRSRRLARQPVAVVGRARPGRRVFPDALDGARMILPGPENAMRTEFDALCETWGVRPSVIAEVDDMATLRLLARDLDALALVPSVVVRDELRARTLIEQWAVPDLFETFYAITARRRYQHPLLASLFGRPERALLTTVGDARPSEKKTLR